MRHPKRVEIVGLDSPIVTRPAIRDRAPEAMEALTGVL